MPYSTPEREFMWDWCWHCGYATSPVILIGSKYLCEECRRDYERSTKD